MFFFLVGYETTEKNAPDIFLTVLISIFFRRQGAWGYECFASLWGRASWGLTWEVVTRSLGVKVEISNRRGRRSRHSASAFRFRSNNERNCGVRSYRKSRKWRDVCSCAEDSGHCRGRFRLSSCIMKGMYRSRVSAYDGYSGTWTKISRASFLRSTSWWCLADRDDILKKSRGRRHMLSQCGLFWRRSRNMRSESNSSLLEVVADFGISKTWQR